MIISLLGILASLAFLIVLAYRGHSVVAIAPIAALIAVAFSGAPLLASYTQIFMPALGNFIMNFFPLFLAGAIFGRLMSVSRYAEDIARWIPRFLGTKRAILVTVIVTALLTYGGISVWVIAFTIVPIATSLFRQSNVSLKLLPAAIVLGSFTFAMAALPGSPQIHNAIPTRYFETTTFAAPLLGIIGAVLTFTLGMLWLEYRHKSLLKRGEGYSNISTLDLDDQDSPPQEADSRDPETSGGDTTSSPTLQDTESKEYSGSRSSFESSIATASVLTARTATETGHAPYSAETHNEIPMREATRRGLIGLLPVLIVVIVNAAFVYLIAPSLDTSYLAEEKFGATSLTGVLGIWSVTVALAAATVTIFALRPKNFTTYVSSLTEGARNAVLPIFTTASEVGYGAVIASLAIFAVLRDSLFGVSDNPVIIGSVATAVISAITGSSSGGLSITLEAFGEQLAQMAQAQGASLDLMHRVIAMASVSFDTLPHNGAIVTLLLVCGLTHRQAYKDIAVVSIFVPLAGVLAVLGLGTLLPQLV